MQTTLLVIALSGTPLAMSASAADTPWSATGGVSAVTTSLPFARAPWSSPDPSIMLGGGYALLDTPHLRWELDTRATFFAQAPIQRGFSLVPGTSLIWTPSFGLRLGARLGAGYAHGFAAQQTFRLEDGVYTPGGNTGRPGGRVEASILAGWSITPTWSASLEYTTAVHTSVPTVGLLVYSGVGLSITRTF